MKTKLTLLLILSICFASCSKDDDDPYDELVTYDNWYRIGDNNTNKEFIRFNRTSFNSNSAYIGGSSKHVKTYNYEIIEEGKIKFYDISIENADILYTDYSVTNGILKIFNGRTYKRGK